MLTPRASLYVLLAATVVASLPMSGQAKPIQISVDAGKVIGEYKPVWNYFGADEPNYTYAPGGAKLGTFWHPPTPHFLVTPSTSPVTRCALHRSGARLPGGAKEGFVVQSATSQLWTAESCTSPASRCAVQCTRLPPDGPKDAITEQPGAMQSVRLRRLTSPGSRCSAQRRAAPPVDAEGQRNSPSKGGMRHLPRQNRDAWCSPRPRTAPRSCPPCPPVGAWRRRRRDRSGRPAGARGDRRMPAQAPRCHPCASRCSPGAGTAHWGAADDSCLAP